MKEKKKDSPEKIVFRCDALLNAPARADSIATACENQCIRTNVSSTKLGRTRS